MKSRLRSILVGVLSLIFGFLVLNFGQLIVSVSFGRSAAGFLYLPVSIISGWFLALGGMTIVSTKASRSDRNWALINTALTGIVSVAVWGVFGATDLFWFYGQYAIVYLVLAEGLGLSLLYRLSTLAAKIIGYNSSGS